jgi:hypothetical protein
VKETQYKSKRALQQQFKCFFNVNEGTCIGRGREEREREREREEGGNNSE